MGSVRPIRDAPRKNELTSIPPIRIRTRERNLTRLLSNFHRPELFEWVFPCQLLVPSLPVRPPLDRNESAKLLSDVFA